ncbi:MAG TPA: Crp/Fnr family transcriptional regulator [Bacteroidales bacterium]
MEIESLRKLIIDLNERQKELNCLYKISALLKSSDAPLNEVLMKVVEEIPSGYRYPEICKVQVILKENVIQSDGFRATELKQSAKIMVENSEVGEVNAFYIKPIKSETGSIFLLEEQKLINAVADEISQFIILHHFRELSKNSKKVSAKFDISLALGNWLTGLNLEVNEIEDILKTNVDFKKGELILKQDGLVSYVFILTEGLVKLSVEDLRNKDFIFKLSKPFEIIGLASVFGDEHSGFSASAILPSSGYLVDKALIKSIVEKNPKFSNKLHNWYCDNLKLGYDKMNFLANKQALGRIAATLLYLGKDVFESSLIENTISRKIIAELSGMSTENAVRILSELRKDKIISIGKDGIRLHNYKLLETYSIAG